MLFKFRFRIEFFDFRVASTRCEFKINISLEFLLITLQYNIKSRVWLYWSEYSNPWREGEFQAYCPHITSRFLLVTSFPQQQFICAISDFPQLLSIAPNWDLEAPYLELTTIQSPCLFFSYFVAPFSDITGLF
jgi:hypothetical protein